MSKPKVIKDYNKLDEGLKQELLSSFPRGFDKYLITFKNHKNKLISALPYETEDFSYFIKMTREQSFAIYQGLEEANSTPIVEVNDSTDEVIEEIEEITPKEVAK